MSEIARPLDEWHEDIGPAVWWFFPMTEAPYIGSPLDTGEPVEVTVRHYHQGRTVEKTYRHYVGAWPGYHTHFTLIPPVPEVKR